MLGAFNENCTISFFKGALLKDDKGILEKPGENSQSDRLIRFTDVGRITELEAVIKNYIYEAVEAEKAGLKVEFKKTSDYKIPAELQNKFDEDDSFKNAFHALTPGRQRGYLLHFSQPEQSKTRTARIKKCLPQIFVGKGLNER